LKLVVSKYKDLLGVFHKGVSKNCLEVKKMKTNSRFLKIMTVFGISLFLFAEAWGVTCTYESQDVPKNIPDYSTTYLYLGKPPSFVDEYATILSTLNVPDSFSIYDADVVLNIKHPWDTDLDVYLIAPDGTQIELFTDVGGSGDNFTETQLDDEASTSITASSAPFTGSFKPEGTLSVLQMMPCGI
jgi:hypothetical protein